MINQQRSIPPVQFVTGGPTLPSGLLQALESGRLVFFCGSGISVPLGLPTFRGLVDEVYSKLKTEITGASLEETAFKTGEYDAVLHFLEARHPGGRTRVREAVADTLYLPSGSDEPSDFSTHEALLRLTMNHHDNAVRLVTTNFDRAFEIAAKNMGAEFKRHVAPLLPVPMNSRWKGLVYLHGLLEDDGDEFTDNLVLTSGDFGLAYLIEQWAARFISSLFQNYNVCFIGYSVNDPVMKYALDALDAYRRLGEMPPETWAFVSYYEGADLQEVNRNWVARGITPINYLQKEHDHSPLHQTIVAWAEAHQPDDYAKEKIVAEYAGLMPTKVTREDDFCSRLVWALSGPKDRPAKIFSQLTPSPPLEWLFEVFAKPYHHFAGEEDVAEHNKHQAEPSSIAGSLIHPFLKESQKSTQLVSRQEPMEPLDSIRTHLGAWLSNYVLDWRLLLWVANAGGRINPGWARIIEEKLYELQENRAHSTEPETPGEVVDGNFHELMGKLWRHVMNGNMESPGPRDNVIIWQRRYRQHGWDVSAAQSLLKLLQPRIMLSEPITPLWTSDREDPFARVHEKVPSIALGLASKWAGVAIPKLFGAQFSRELMSVLPSLEAALLQGLALLQELTPSGSYDPSMVHLASIESHEQNRRFHDWTFLIELVREAWLGLNESDETSAARRAHLWMSYDHPTFKRLAFYAAAKNNQIAPESWVEWLLSEDAKWLWALETRREVCQLFVAKGKDLTVPLQEQIVSEIVQHMPSEPSGPLEGRAGEHYRAGTLFLKKLQHSICAPGDALQQALDKFEQALNMIQISSDQSEEFPFWLSVGWEPSVSPDDEPIPATVKELVSWIKGNHIAEFDSRSPWNKWCEVNPSQCVKALGQASTDGNWPATHWQNALRIWSDPENFGEVGEFIFTQLQSVQANHIYESRYSIARWMYDYQSKSQAASSQALDLADKILNAIQNCGGSTNESDLINNDVMTTALNDPVGLVAQMAISMLFKEQPRDEDGLDRYGGIQKILTRISDATAQEFRFGRVMLAFNLVSFFRIDQEWVSQHLLPSFSNENTHEMLAVWEGFLHSRRAHPQLIMQIKTPLLTIRSLFSQLSNNAQFAYMSLLTHLAFNPQTGLTREDLKAPFQLATPQALALSLQHLINVTNGVDTTDGCWWQEQFMPFWDELWPKDKRVLTWEISDLLGRLMIQAAGWNFPAAITTLQDWFRAGNPYSILVSALRETTLCRQFPNEALEYLNLTVQSYIANSDELVGCLNQIKEAAPDLAEDERFKRLLEVAKP